MSALLLLYIVRVPYCLQKINEVPQTIDYYSGHGIKLNILFVEYYKCVLCLSSILPCYILNPFLEKYKSKTHRLNNLNIMV